jgi:hypothetical protein
VTNNAFAGLARAHHRPGLLVQLKLERADAEAEAEMAKTRFDALGLAPGTPITLRPLEFGLFPTAECNPAVANPLVLPAYASLRSPERNELQRRWRSAHQRSVT